MKGVILACYAFHYNNKKHPVDVKARATYEKVDALENSLNRLLLETKCHVEGLSLYAFARYIRPEDKYATLGIRSERKHEKQS